MAIEDKLLSNESIKTDFKVGIYLPVYFVQMGIAAMWPSLLCVTW